VLKLDADTAVASSHVRLLGEDILLYLSVDRHVSRSTLIAVERSQLLARWPGTLSRILSGIQRAAQTVLGVYLKRSCSRVTSASSALGVLNDYALYKSTHSLLKIKVECKSLSSRLLWPLAFNVFVHSMLGGVAQW